MRLKMIELLSPVGDFECLKAAVQNGADAVYFGANLFSARAFASNFDDKILEDEADELACSLLIPHEDFFRFKRRGNFSIGEIIKFSQEVNIHPSIVIGRLQHEGIIGWNMYNDYKIKVDII